MSLPALNGPKDARVLLARDLAKQPPRGPFARELRNQTGGNKRYQTENSDFMIFSKLNYLKNSGIT